MIEVFKYVFMVIGISTTTFILIMAIKELITVVYKRRKSKRIAYNPNNYKWISATYQPDTRRDVMIVIGREIFRGWCTSTGRWFMFLPGSNEVTDCIACHPSHWRDIK